MKLLKFAEINKTTKNKVSLEVIYIKTHYTVLNFLCEKNLRYKEETVLDR